MLACGATYWLMNLPGRLAACPYKSRRNPNHPGRFLSEEWPNYHPTSAGLSKIFPLIGTRTLDQMAVWPVLEARVVLLPILLVTNAKSAPLLDVQAISQCLHQWHIRLL